MDKTTDKLKSYIINNVLIDEKTNCWVWQKSLNKDGYGQCGKSINGKKVRYSSHRLSYLAFNGILSRKLNVNHICHNRKCVNPDHLYAGTHKENMRDRYIAGTTARGENHGKAKLTNDDVKEIRRLKGIKSYKELGKIYNIHPIYVYKIWKGDAFRRGEL